MLVWLTHREGVGVVRGGVEGAGVDDTEETVKIKREE